MIPKNEQGVVVLFAQQAKEAGFEIIDIGTKFPDATIRKGGITYRAEFEYQSSNFVAHRHDPRKCDVIIVWKDDYRGLVLPVLELSNEEWKTIPINLPSKEKREIGYWKQRALSAERRMMSNLDGFQSINNTRIQAKIILEQNPYMSGSELGRALGCSSSFGRRLKRQIASEHSSNGIQVLSLGKEPETEQAK